MSRIIQMAVQKEEHPVVKKWLNDLTSKDNKTLTEEITIIQHQLKQTELLLLVHKMSLIIKEQQMIIDKQSEIK
jgi:uncharacterized protein YacL (UPF0231 family)